MWLQALIARAATPLVEAAWTGELCRQLCRWLAKTPPTVNNCHRAGGAQRPVVHPGGLAPPNGLRVIDQPYDPVGIVANQVRKHQRGGYEARRARGRPRAWRKSEHTDEFVLPEPGSFHGARQIVGPPLATVPIWDRPFAPACLRAVRPTLAEG